MHCLPRPAQRQWTGLSVLVALVVTVGAVLHASPDPSNSSLSASSRAIVADGSSTSTITVTLRDAGNTPLTAGGNTVVVASTLGTVSGVTDNGDGTYTATLTAGTTVASAKVTATVDGTPVTTPLYVNFTTQLVTGTRVDDVGTSNSIAAGNTSRNLAVGADGTIYAVFRGSDGIRVASSRNRGVSFGASVQVSTDNLEAEVAVSTTGVVYVTWIAGGAVVSRSFDNGATWSAPVTAGPAGSSVHMATDASRVYLVERSGNNFYWSDDNAATFTRVQLNAGEVFTDVHVDPLTGHVIVQVDNPSVKYLVSSDGGQTFSGKIQPSPAGSVFYSVGAISSGSLGRYLFVAGNGSNMYRVDMGAANVAGLTTTAVSQVIGTNTSNQGRSLAADRCGNIVVGYISGSDVKFDVSNDLGGAYNAPVTVAAATDANVYINQTNGDILFLYESGGHVSLSTYAGHLGNCYSPEVSVSTVAFSGALVGQTSSPQSVRITNGGGVPVQITGITANGDFAASTSCVGTLAVGASCEIPVTFTPTANGTRTGDLEIDTNIFVEPRVVTLTGVGLTTAPVATLAPTAVNFGTVAPSVTSAAQSVTLSNSGNQDLTISSFTMSGPFALSANTCGATVVPMASCTLSVTATPASTDAATGSLRLVSNASGAPPTVLLEVNGVPPTVTNATPVANDDAYTVDEDAVLTVATGSGVLANDTDADSDPLTAVLGTGPVHGTLALNADGSFIYTPTANYSGSDSFTYVATDGTASSAAATVTLTVTAVDDAPTLDQPAPLTARWDAGAQTVTLTGLTAGGGEAGALTVTATSGTPATAIASAVTYGGGSTATFTLTPVAGRQGVVTITVAVSDGTTTTTRTFTFTVTAPAFAVTGVYPASGPDTGGTNIRITGLGFLQSATVVAGAQSAAVVAPQVLIGGVPAVAAVVESGTVISALTPALPPGTPLDVQVIVPAGTGTLSGAFTPYSRPAPPAPPTEPTDPGTPPPDPTNPGDPTAPTTDTDGDGIPDVWEEFYGTDPNDASDAAADPDGDGKTNREEFDSNTHPDSRLVRFFAEGNAQAPFRTWVNLYNPSPIEAAINITFYLDDATVVHHLVKAAGGSRTTVDTSVVAGLRNHAFGMRVDADESVVVNRTITWNEQGVGAAAERGVELSSSWYFAEGATHGRLQTFALLTNPADQPATVEIEYLVSASGARVSRTHVVPAHARYTVWVNQEGPELVDQGFGMVVRSSHPIVAERATYITDGGLFEAGETSVGAPAAGQDWYFAEGVTGPVFGTFLLLANPTATAADVQVRYLPEAGAEVVTTHTVGPYSRVTVPVSDEAAWETGMGVGMHVHVTNGVDIVAERAMWWSTDTNAATWEEGHGSAGSTAPHTAFAIGDGVAGGPQGASTYLLLANPGTSPAVVRVTLVFEDGTAPASTTLTIPAGRRVTVDAATDFPVADGKRFSATVQSENSVPFVAEQSIYWTFGTGTWRSGVSLPATRLP